MGVLLHRYGPELAGPGLAAVAAAGLLAWWLW